MPLSVWLKFHELEVHLMKLMSLTMALELTQPLIERRTKNLPGGKERLTSKADNLNTICEPIVQKMCNS
jgi:hypothetical protein